MLGAGRPSWIEIGVGEIGDHPERLALRQRDHLLEELQIDDGAGGVVRVVDDEPLRLAGRARQRRFDLAVGIAARTGRDGNRLAAGDDHAEAVDRITGVGRQDAVPLADERQQEVGEPFLRAEGDDRLGLGIEARAVVAPVPVADRLADLGEPARRHVAVVGRALRLGVIRRSIAALGLAPSGLPRPKSKTSFPSARSRDLSSSTAAST